MIDLDKKLYSIHNQEQDNSKDSKPRQKSDISDNQANNIIPSERLAYKMRKNQAKSSAITCKESLVSVNTIS